MCGRDHCVPHTGQQHSEAPSRLHFTAEKTDSRRVKRCLNVTERTNGAGLCPVGVTPVLPSTTQATLLSQEGVSEVTEARAPLCSRATTFTGLLSQTPGLATVPPP